MKMLSEAIIPLTPTADHTGKEGYFVLATGGLVTSATATAPLGVILEGFPTTGKDSVALPNFGGTVKVKVTDTSPGSIIRGSTLSLKADGTVQLDAGTGARIQVAIALESGAAGELIEAILIKPRVIGNAVTLGNVDNAIGSLTIGGTYSQSEVQALRNATETLADDVRALYAALQAASQLA